MRRQLHRLPMWQECRGNNQSSERDKRPRATSTFRSLSLSPPPSSLPRAALSARALPPPLHGAGIGVWQPNPQPEREQSRAEERRSSLKENSGVHNPPLRCQQLRWRAGEGASSELISPSSQLQEGTRGRRGEARRQHTMAGCVRGDEMAYRRAEGFSLPVVACVPPPSLTPHTRRGKETAERARHTAVCACVTCLLGGRRKNGDIVGEREGKGTPQLGRADSGDLPPG